MKTKDWLRVSREKPCVICERPDWCRFSADGAVALCARVSQGSFSEAKNGGGYFHRLRDRADYQTTANPQPVKKTNSSLTVDAKSWPTLDGAIESARRGVAAKAGGAVLAGRWIYADAGGDEVAVVARFDLPTAKGQKQLKTFRPCRRVAGGWAVGDPSGLWPLYRLPALAGARRVYVCEGEKSADAAASCGLAATTSAHGAQSPEKTDWTPLASAAEIIILPDNDEAGEAYAKAVAALVWKVNPAAVTKMGRLPGLPA